MNGFQVNVSDKSVFLAKLPLPPSGERERAAMSHLRDPFAFLLLSCIKPCHAY